MKLSTNELIFPLVTHMAQSDARFDSYGFLNAGQDAEQIMGRLDRRMNDPVLRAKMCEFEHETFC
jgi:hypothetical protein